MGDLVKEPLRCFVTGNPVGTDTWKLGGGCQCTGCRAAAHIEALEEALKPFADYARCYDAEHSWNGEYSAPDHCLVVGDIMWEGGHIPRIGDLRRARAVLEDK